jgi:hypothetical protein
MGIIRISVLAAVLSLAGFGCAVDDDSAMYEYVNGQLIDMSKFAGCGWVIDYEGHKLEPQNIADFAIVLADSIQVRFAYDVATDQNSECMMGTVVKLIDIYRK